MGISTLRNTLVVGLLVTASAQILNAQSPRMVLFEEMSNASCVPCAAQNPTYHAYITQHMDRILPISFRSRYPGRDVMHDADPTMHDGRVAFYGSPGVPNVVVNGIPSTEPTSGFYAGAAADTAAESRELAKTSATSPVSIAVVENRYGNNSDVTVTVSSTQALSGKKLRMIVVEAHHYYTSAGGNGEKDFYNVARKMLPTLDGVDLTLAANETKTFQQSYQIDAANWNADQVYVVAFVQDDNTKEVYNAAASTFMPKLLLSLGQPEANVQSTVSQSNWTGAVTSSVGGQYRFTISKKLPAGWTATVTLGGSPAVDGDTATLTKDMPSDLAVAIVPSGGKPGMGRVSVEISNGHQEVTKIFRLFAGKADVAVLVRDEGNAAIADKYDEALGKTDRSYFLLDQGIEGQFNLADFKVVGMEVGKSILSGADVEKLKAYLNGGGRLFLAGAEIAWGLVDSGSSNQGYYSDPLFVTNYLHSTYVADGSTAQTTVNGVAGDPVAGGLSMKINNGVANQDTPDQIVPLEGAVQTCTYNNSTGAGVRYADKNYRLVYFGFGLEGIGDATLRSSLVDKSIAWLLGNDLTIAGVRSGSLAGTALNVSPNPVTGMMDIPLTLSRAMHVSVSLYDMRGARIAVITDGEFEGGATLLRFDASSVPAGAYALVMSTPEGRTSTMVTVVR
ncbi:MAG: Omp28-related outer membrane protein [Bacteroidetes bacterium]|nr:Omp28-related outer membrane protein [Bacteroidota bacterium]